MVPNQFLNFLDLCGPSNSHHRGLKLLPWDRQRLMLKCIILSITCQNFSSIGPIGKKFDVFAKMAFKTTALWPLKVMDQFLGPHIVERNHWIQHTPLKFKVLTSNTTQDYPSAKISCSTLLHNP